MSDSSRLEGGAFLLCYVFCELLIKVHLLIDLREVCIVCFSVDDAELVTVEEASVYAFMLRMQVNFYQRYRSQLVEENYASDPFLFYADVFNSCLD